MKSYQHILVPIDGSDHSKQALQHAIDIARITGGAITLLSVANMADIINQFGQMENTSELTMDEMTASAQANSTGILKQFAAMVPDSIPVQSIFELSAPEAAATPSVSATTTSPGCTSMPPTAKKRRAIPLHGSLARRPDHQDPRARRRRRPPDPPQVDRRPGS